MALGLGANLGTPDDIAARFRASLDQLSRNLDAELQVASLYRGAAVSDLPQADFFNTAAVGHTRLEPEAILAIAKALELGAGRRSGRRWAARPLDVDLLLYGDHIRAAPELTLPHPRLAERRFVLAPLAELAPRRRVPPRGAAVRQLLDELPASAPTVERLAWPALAVPG